MIIITNSNKLKMMKPLHNKHPLQNQPQPKSISIKKPTPNQRKRKSVVNKITSILFILNNLKGYAFPLEKSCKPLSTNKNKLKTKLKLSWDSNRYCF